MFYKKIAIVVQKIIKVWLWYQQIYGSLIKELDKVLITSFNVRAIEQLKVDAT